MVVPAGSKLLCLGQAGVREVLPGRLGRHQAEVPQPGPGAPWHPPPVQRRLVKPRIRAVQPVPDTEPPVARVEPRQSQHFSEFVTNFAATQQKTQMPT